MAVYLWEYLVHDVECGVTIVQGSTWMVFPMPISSARMPPRISLLSWDTAQARNSFWKGSRDISISAGGSIC